MPETTTVRLWSVMAGALLVTLIGAYLSLTNGIFDISIQDIVKTLLRIDSSREHDLVVFQFRLPRIVLAILVGSALGMAGAVIQGVTRNGLADPGILGINAGAGMAVVLFLFLFQGQMKLTGWGAVMMMPVFGLVGGLLATVLIYMFAREQGRLDPQRLLLVGIAIASGFGALTLYVSLKMNPNDFETAAVWLAGSIYSANWKFVATMLPWLLILPPILWWKARSLDLFQLGEHSATGLGVPVERVKNQLLIGSIGLVSASVAVSGSIGFVGLIAPHVARRLVGLRHRSILPVSALIGAAMVVFGDFIGKTIFAPAELSVGIVISIIGVPYFVYLLIRSKK
ncbi:iron ABC transporter permease [Paenibacillus sp. FSL A5-0031]|uniref:FecCD family ABC transporter permease n=1 Tax=Paenibacillus sp. FSL A5-0031 TaxID=1920420 RepID=UPI00096D829B|nr:iron ABC transporter permease [Paenibacillus sp. FSL A5-0031]OME85152.1 iron ABC transporter permease [Paenibacillus sp. FSL A5-0031]